MVSSKSLGEFYLNLCVQLIRRDPLDSPQSRKNLMIDIQTLKRRCQTEGLSFLTKTLPKLGKALDSGLLSSRFALPREFKRTHRLGSTPAFLQAYFNRVFDSEGLLLEHPDVSALKHIRQVCMFAYKLAVPYSKSEELTVVNSFISTDEELSLLEFDQESRKILALAARITEGVFGDFDPKDILPRHGPGAVATGEKLEEKWEFSRLYQGIHQCYPYYSYFTVGWSRELSDRLDWYRSLQRHENGTAKVVLVPKDSRGPRLISCEPLEYQWIQQGLGRKLAMFLEWDSTYTKNHVNFERQDINRSLALDSSRYRDFATLDLKDASDRVSLALVREIFSRSPRLLRHLEACRTTSTTLPDGRVIALNKFAPMGSALCFPVEAYIFWVLLVAADVWATREPLRRVGERYYVYGDDIVIPVDAAPRCIQILESVGLKVNRDKSCITGSFRESCGIEAFNGHDITPIRLKSLWTDRSTDGSALSAYTSLANRLGQSGYTSASLYLWAKLQALYGFIPFGTSSSGFPSKEVNSPELAISLNRKYVRWRVNRRLQRLEFSVALIKPIRMHSKLDSWPRLLRNMVSGSPSDPSVVVVPRSTKIKRGWAAVFS